MSEEQLRDLLILIVLCLVFFGSIIYWMIALSKSYKVQGVFRLMSFIETLEGEPLSYKIYTTGHPFVWVEISLIEAKERIENDCSQLIPGVGSAPKASRFLLKVNKARKSLYIVFTHKQDFNWDSLLHYDEWLASKKY